MIRAHHILNWAEICSPVHSSFNKACLLFAIVLVHPPAPLLLMSAPLCQFSSGLLKEMLMKESSFNAFLSQTQTLLSPFLRTCCFFLCMCVLTVCLCLMLIYILCFNMLLNVHVLCAKLLLSYSILYWGWKLFPDQFISSDAYLLELHHFAVKSLWYFTIESSERGNPPKKHPAQVVNCTLSAVLFPHPTHPLPHLNSLCS